MKYFLGILLSLSFASSAHATKIVGNGGDMCEDRIKTIRDDLSSWIANGGATGLSFSSGVLLSQYTSAMNDEIAAGNVSCTDENVTTDGVQKTCINFIKSGAPQILCNRTLFMQTSDSDQYILIHHEYAGLAGLEVNGPDGSMYLISNQITGFLENQVVKKLAVKPCHDSAVNMGSIVNGVMTMHAGCTGSDAGFSYPDVFAIYVCTNNFDAWIGRALGTGMILTPGTQQIMRPNSKWSSQAVQKIQCVP
jgi:hypothetical protein